MMLLQLLLTLACTATAIPTIPEPAQVVEPQDPLITAPPDPTRTRTYLQQRDLLSDFEADVGSVLSDLGSVPSYVASGIANFFQDFPTGDKVQSSLGINDAQLKALPTQVLNLSPYANWTSNGWNVRFHGNVYKQPNTSTQDLNKLANKFLVDVDITSLPPSQQDQARNLTASIFVVQQPNVTVSPIQIQVGQSGGGGSTSVMLPFNTTKEGDFDVFMPIVANGLMPGNSTQQIQHLSTHFAGATLGNATAYLVPDEGITIIMDIDDTLRVTKIYQPKEGLLNSFARPFTAWQNMPAIMASWLQSLPNLHFHYLTTTPEQGTRLYMDYIFKTYPAGSFDTRPLNFSNIDETLAVRKYLLEKIIRTYPKRKFVLIGDTSNADVMKDYPAMATQFPGQIQCIFLRNVTASDSSDHFPYNTKGFKNLNQSNYMFFVNSDDLHGLDIAGGQCYNKSVAQNLTFDYQGIPGRNTDTAINASATHVAGASRIVGGSILLQVGFSSLLALLFLQLL